MSGPFVPAAAGTRAAFHLQGGRVVLRAVLAWQVRTGFDARADPVTLVAKDSLPVDNEMGIAIPSAIVFENGHVESIDGGRCWASVGDYCNSNGRKLVGA